MYVKTKYQILAIINRQILLFFTDVFQLINFINKNSIYIIFKNPVSTWNIYI